jgi:hypothetical protein
MKVTRKYCTKEEKEGTKDRKGEESRKEININFGIVSALISSLFSP